MTLPNKTEHRAIVDTHRHPWGQKMQAKMAERGLFDPKQGFPQTNAQDLMAYREVFDLDYAMPIQREGGITLSLMTNGGADKPEAFPGKGSALSERTGHIQVRNTESDVRGKTRAHGV
jgi:hypothetical protein